MTEASHQSAHVLLDALSAFDDLTNPNPDPAIRLALRRLEDIGAVSLLIDDEAQTTSVDVQPLLHAALELLAATTAARMREDPTLTGEGIIQELRAVIDLAASD
ncbi:hypothetical protein [Nocardioides lijunqiniae]|uniref:hypothetical protein n=1 Tax=Nocardioides lijunqiniae TaxID=2760832 RepID=UPI001878640C|nr:hypothetical protein [Nocardioides lijunqiniae]